jgi:hypothetical protein
MQIIIAFDTRFWPAQLYDVVCTHSFVPEMWMTQHTVIDDSSKHLHAVVGEHKHVLHTTLMALHSWQTELDRVLSRSTASALTAKAQHWHCMRCSA